MRITRRKIISGTILGLALAVGGCFYPTNTPVLDTKEKAKFLENFVRENGTRVNSRHSKILSFDSGLKGEYRGKIGTYFISVMDNKKESGYPYNERIHPILRISLENSKVPMIMNIADHKTDGEVDLFEKRENRKVVLAWNRMIHGNRSDLQGEYSEIVNSLYGKLK